MPKRTGRKRKRGSDEPFQGDLATAGAQSETTPVGEEICSVARRDEPVGLRQRLQDNVGRYSVEAVGVVKHTHRYRGTCFVQLISLVGSEDTANANSGLADFQYSMGESKFMNRFVHNVLPGSGMALFNPDSPRGTL